jgi:hypothetical protein
MNGRVEQRQRADVQEEENVQYLPFNIQWLDSSYQQTCLPDSPWQKVRRSFSMGVDDVFLA